jgi:integrase
MARPPLPIGTAGRFKTKRDGRRWVSTCGFRDFDGEVRKVSRWGDTQTQAENRLREAIRDRRVEGAEISSETLVPNVATVWFTELREHVELGNRSATTVDTYMHRWTKLVQPRVKSFRVRELLPGRVDRILQDVNKSHSASTARTCRAVLSGICAVAVRHGALKTNPVREARPIEDRKRRSAPRALAVDEALHMLELFDDDEIAARQDLPDIARYLAGTGNRTGESLAVRWEDIDFGAKIASVVGNVVWVNGEGLVVNEGKTAMAERGVALADWLVSMLLDRRTRVATRLGCASEEVTGWVFPNTQGGLRHPSNLRRDWRAFRDRHELGSWFTPKTWRRTVGTILTDTLPAREASDVLGHSKVSLTLDIYVGRRAPSRRPAEVLAALGGPVISERRQGNDGSKPEP